MRGKEIVALLLLAALWGASFLFIRITASALGPFLAIEGRVAIAAAALFMYALFTKKVIDIRAYWRQYLVLGALNAAIPFTLIAAAELYLHASMSSILNSLTPLFTALVAWGWLKEVLSVKKQIAIALGTAGVAILVGWSPMPVTYEFIVAVGCSILSTVSYGFAGVYTKKTFSGVSPLSLTIGQQTAAAILLLPFALMYAPKSTEQITPLVIYAVIGLAIFCTAIAYVLYFYLIEHVGPTKTLSVTFIVPLFGIVWGALFLHEALTFGMIAGLAVIFISMLLISDIRLKAQPKQPTTLKH